MEIRSTSPTWSPTSSSGPTARATSTSSSSSGTRPAASAHGSGTPPKSWPGRSSRAITCTSGARPRSSRGRSRSSSPTSTSLDPDRVEPEDFLPQSSQNVAKLMARLREVLLAMGNPHLRALVECFLIDDEFVRKFTAAPGGDQEPPRLPGRAARARRHPAQRRRPDHRPLSRDRSRPAADRHLPPRHRQGRRAVATTGPSPTPTRASSSATWSWASRCSATRSSARPT